MSLGHSILDLKMHNLSYFNKLNTVIVVVHSLHGGTSGITLYTVLLYKYNALQGNQHSAGALCRITPSPRRAALLFWNNSTVCCVLYLAYYQWEKKYLKPHIQSYSQKYWHENEGKISYKMNIIWRMTDILGFKIWQQCIVLFWLTKIAFSNIVVIVVTVQTLVSKLLEAYLISSDAWTGENNNSLSLHEPRDICGGLFHHRHLPKKAI